VELLLVLHRLWERRIIVALGVLMAVAAGLLAGRSGQAPGSAVGTVRMLLDTTDSQLVKGAPTAADTLSTRAALLADDLASDTGSRIVAQRAGVHDEQLAILGPSARMVPPLDSPLVGRLSVATSSASAPYVVDVFADGLTPIISIEAHAADAARAGRLADAAAGGLQALLVADDSHGSRGFVLDKVAALRTKHVVGASPHRRLLMVAGALVVFGFWCMCVVVVDGTSRRHGWARRRGAGASPTRSADG
jgi:hypothetical protein